MLLPSVYWFTCEQIYYINRLKKKMKSIAVLLNLLQYFYYWIQCDKTCNFVHDEAF